MYQSIIDDGQGSPEITPFCVNWRENRVTKDRFTIPEGSA